MTRAPTAKTIEKVMLELLAERGPSTACPSDVARRVDPEDWRPLMPKVREVADRLAKRDVIAVSQKGQPADALTAKGPIRLRLFAAIDGSKRRRTR